MTPTQLIILILAGLLAGFVGGSMGVGGGIILVPTMVFFLGMTQHEAQGTSLATLLLPIGILAVINYYKSGYVNIRYAIILSIMFIVGSYLGSVLSVHLSDRILKQIFGILMLAVGIKMILGK